MSITEQTLFNPDDPRLTAYALGELTDPAERAQVEQLLAASTEARAELADIRSLTAALTAEYEQERFAAADETVAANVVQMHRSFWRRHQFGAIAALLVVGGLAALFALPMLVQRRKATSGPVFAEQKPGRMPRAQAAAIDNEARIADGKAVASAAATPSSPLLAQNDPPQDRDVRELVVPPGQPLPTNLPADTKAVYGPAPVTGVVGGNPAAASGSGGALLFAKNKEGKDAFTSDKNTAFSLPSAPADAETSKQSETGQPPIAAAAPAMVAQMKTFSRGWAEGVHKEEASVAGKPAVVTGPVTASPAGEINTARDNATGSTSSRLLAQTKSATRRNAVDRVVVTGSNIPSSEEVGTSPVGTIDQATRDHQSSIVAAPAKVDISKLKDQPPLSAPAPTVVNGYDKLSEAGGNPPLTTDTQSQQASGLVGSARTGARGEIQTKPQPKKRFALSFGDSPAAAPMGRAILDSTAGSVTTTTTTTTASAEPDMDGTKRASAIGDVPVVGRLFKEEAELNKKLSRAEARLDTAEYAHTVENAFLGAKENPLSTFSIDVDTASYAIARRFIEAGSLPPPDAVRVEEMINYFPYADAPPAPGSDKPFAIHLEAAACPWNTAHRLVRIGIKGKEIDNDKRPPSNLVFLLDVSGSMMPEERLPLIKRSLHLMVDRLREDDHVAIVVYAGESGLAMPPTSGDHKDAILSAIDNLHAGGSTNGASGIKLAYNVARKEFIKGGTNRVILATDGDFNVGVTSQSELLRLIEKERADGVFLSVLGVGTDNLKDSTMQTLADHGNGNYNYIDRLEEGKKVLVSQMSGTLVAIAKDVKIQVEFNPAAVASYRLIGYEKRMLKKEDFNNDKIDAGEIGAGHNVTALYEVVPVGQPVDGTGAVDALKYQPAPPAPEAAPAIPHTHQTALPEMLTVKMRHKAPDSDTSERSYEVPLIDRGAPGEFANASTDFQFAAAVASFGMILRDSPYKGDATMGSALELARSGLGEDAKGYRAGFIELVQQAQAVQRERGR